MNVVDWAAGEKAENIRVGQRLRASRQARGISVRALAEASGISTGMISQIERGLSAPSLRSLRLLASALDMQVAAFFAEPASSRAEQSSVFVVHKDERALLKLTPTGVFKQLLTPSFPGMLELFDVKLNPGGTSGPEFYQHPGEKAGLVLAGTLRLFLNGEPTLLREGDSFRFPSTLAHRFDNPARDITHVFWVVARLPSPENG